MDSDPPTPVPCGCPQGRARIRLLDGVLGVTFAISGLVVMGDVWELRERSEEDLEFRIGDKSQRLMVTEAHEYIHFLQAVGSSYLQWHAHAQLQAAYGLLRWGPGNRSYLDGYRELSGTLSRPGAEGLSCLDILESGAVLEGYMMLRERWRKPVGTAEALHGFAPEVAAYRANPAKGRYHVAYDWGACLVLLRRPGRGSAVGPDREGQLCPVACLRLLLRDRRGRADQRGGGGKPVGAPSLPAHHVPRLRPGPVPQVLPPAAARAAPRHVQFHQDPRPGLREAVGADLGRMGDVPRRGGVISRK